VIHNHYCIVLYCNGKSSNSQRKQIIFESKIYRFSVSVFTCKFYVVNFTAFEKAAFCYAPSESLS
jgi:hypothetical protein